MHLKNTQKSVSEKAFSVVIFGLGYIGFPLAVRLSNANLRVFGVDINEERVQRLKNCNLMDSENDYKENFMKAIDNKMITFSTEHEKSEQPQVAIICVPTPIPTSNIQSDVYVKSAVEKFLTIAKKGDVIILESSIEIGTTENIQELIEEKGFSVGNDFGLAFCPERIDPANKEWGIENIPRIIYCSDETTFEISEMIYQNVNGGNLIRVESPKIAEVVKSFENAFRLVNISLVNELAVLCDTLGISARDVIDSASTKPFGFMAHYPGGGAGGHCIPKDPRFLLESAKKNNLNFSTIENALQINRFMPKYISDSINKICEKQNITKKILIFGLSYKANVEDMRDSPSFKIILELKKNGFEVFGYDSYFKIENLKKYLIENHVDELNFKVIDKIDNKIFAIDL